MEDYLFGFTGAWLQILMRGQEIYMFLERSLS
jgi:hypothetical protein